MKKEHILLTSFLLCSIFGFTQNKIKQKTTIPQVEAAPTSSPKTIDPDFLKAAKFNSKAFGDTLFYDDFDSLRWTVVNNNPNNFLWRWDTVYSNGQFSNANNIITSTSAANGFMVLPADFYNTPIAMSGIPMDTYFESGSIDLTKGGTTPRGFCSVWVSYQQALRYCCSGANRLVLQVSSDNFITFQEYDATNSLAVNAASGTFTNIINISSAAAFTPNIKVRFLSEGNTHYYWMIDDFAIIEGPNNDLELITPYVEFNYDYAYNPFYGQIPYDLMTPLRLSGSNYNNGCNTLTGVQLKGNFIHVADELGNPGVGSVFNSSSTPDTVFPGATYTAVTNAPHFTATLLGEFRVDLLSDSDSLDENLGNETYSQTFSTSDTILARDDDGYAGGTGPGSFVRNNQPGGTVVGDKFGTLYIVESRTGNGGVRKVPTSITFAVSNDSSNIGVEIVPKIWEYDEDSLLGPTGTIAAAFGREVASTFIPYTIQNVGTLLTIPLDNGPAVLNGLDSGQYVVGWEVTNTNGGNSFEVQVDASSGQYQDNVTCFIDLAHSPGWGWVDANPVIRLNMGNLPIPTSLKNEVDSNTTLTIQPNPSNGEFNLTFETTGKSTFQLTVRNSLGQLVYSDIINIQGGNSKRFDFSRLDKGIYYISLQNESESLVETVVIH